MNFVAVFFLTTCVCFAAQEETNRREPNVDEVIHVATALDHLSVLEFAEPVTMVASGSAAFQIERHDGRVFIKPLRAGTSTNLLVWTASRRFFYELEPAGEVINMNFAIDRRLAATKPVADASATGHETPATMLARAFLEARPVDSGTIKDRKDRVIVRVEHVLQSKNNLYLHYSVRNLGQRPYRLLMPTVRQLLPLQPAFSLASYRQKQLDKGARQKLGKAGELALAAHNLETPVQDVAAGKAAQGIIVVSGQADGALVLELTFAPDGAHPVQAVVVL